MRLKANDQLRHQIDAAIARIEEKGTPDSKRGRRRRTDAGEKRARPS